MLIKRRVNQSLLESTDRISALVTSEQGEKLKRQASDAGESVKSSAKTVKKQVESEGETVVDKVFHVLNDVKDSVLGKH